MRRTRARPCCAHVGWSAGTARSATSPRASHRRPRRRSRWTETAGYKYGGIYRSPQAVLENVFAKIQADFESFTIDVGRLIEGGNVVVMQGHYVGKGKATGKSVRAAVAHVLEISDGKIVRFDQYVDSATINPIIGA
jgi:ketosteroid isomerase-like protein